MKRKKYKFLNNILAQLQKKYNDTAASHFLNLEKKDIIVTTPQQLSPQPLHPYLTAKGGDEQ